MTTNKSVCTYEFNGVGPAQLSNKTVECLLEKTFEKIAVTEANIELFNTLIDLGLATNDVKNFIMKQTIHLRGAKRPAF